MESPREHQNGKSSDIVPPPKRKSDDLGDTPSNKRMKTSPTSPNPQPSFTSPSSTPLPSAPSYREFLLILTLWPKIQKNTEQLLGQLYFRGPNTLGRIVCSNCFPDYSVGVLPIPSDGNLYTWKGFGEKNYRMIL